MNAFTFCKGICTYVCLACLLFSTTDTNAQLADSLAFTDFNEDMGLWTQSQFAQIVPISPDSGEGWLLLERQEGLSLNGAPHDDPFIATGLLSLEDFCGVDLEFDVTTFNLSGDSHIYVDVSSDRGESFQIMRTDQEQFSLTTDNQFQNGQRETVSFPLRSFLSDSLILRINTRDIDFGTKVFIDNIRLKGKESEDFMVASWQMGSDEEIDLAEKLEPQFEPGNCFGVVAYPATIAREGNHFGVEGYSHEFLAQTAAATEATNLADGALCIDLSSEVGDDNSISFGMFLTPFTGGAITGFEFMERSPEFIGLDRNNYPSVFELRIYKDERLVFSETNIHTTPDWSDRVFRLDHVSELAAGEPANYRFELTPRLSPGLSSDMSVWMIDEVRIMGGCCVQDCKQLDVNIFQDEREEGIVLIPNIEDEEVCREDCLGNISNQTAEAVSVITGQSSGWSYFNNATTVSNAELDMVLPESFEAHSFRLNTTKSSSLQYIETDVVNLCPGETYSVCFDYLSTFDQENTNNRARLFSLVDGKKRFVTGQLDSTQSCMTFLASDNEHRVRLSLDNGDAVITQSEQFYLDNVVVDRVPVEEQRPLSTIWSSESGDDLHINSLPTAQSNVEYTFFQSNSVDSTSIYNEQNLYSICFNSLITTSSANVERIVVSLDGLIDKTFYPEQLHEDYCFSFLHNRIEQGFSFQAFAKDGTEVPDDFVRLEEVQVFFNSLGETVSEPTGDFEWTLPDGTTSSNLELLADQDGDYFIQYNNCVSCSESAIYRNDIRKDVCPRDAILTCDASLDPDDNPELRLITPQAPYSIGESSFSDSEAFAECGLAVNRRWTVERLFRGEFYDSTFCFQRISLTDSEAPIFSELFSQELSCLADIPEPRAPQVEDNCDTNIKISSRDIFLEGLGCPDIPQYMTRVWTAIDACGNTSEIEEDFTIIYDMPTVNCPPSRMVTCYEEISIGEPEIEWECDVLTTSFDTNLVLVDGAPRCNGAIYNMIYTVTDLCGRSQDCVQEFELQGQSLNLTCPFSSILTCIEDFESVNPLVVSTCNQPYNLFISEPLLVDGLDYCNGAEYRVTYSILDVCGLEAQCIQQVILENPGVNISCPSAVEITCPDDIVADVPTITSFCGADASYVTESPTLVSGVQECHNAVYEIEYTATDACGNTASCQQQFVVINEGLDVTCPPDYEVECFSQIITGIPELTSFCNTDPSFIVSEPVAQSSALSCDGEIYLITYTAFDNCANEVSCIQNVSLSSVAPTMTCPTSVVVECIDDFIPTSPVVQTLCGVNYTISNSLPFLDFGEPMCSGSEYLVEYEFIDDCNIELNCYQSVIIEHEALELVCPENLTVIEINDVVPSSPIVEQRCGIDITMSNSEPFLTYVDCTVATYQIDYTVSNQCMESSSCSQLITLTDEANALDSDFICANAAWFVSTDCDLGGINDAEECSLGLNPEMPCDDVSFIIEPTPVLCFGENSGSISISVLNGNQPYEFSLDSLVWDTALDINNLYAGNYTLYIQSTFGPDCQFQFPVTLTEPPLTDAEAGPSKEMCINDSVVLEASGGVSYTWSNGMSGAAIEVSPLTTTIYTVTVTQSNGCFNTDQVEVIANQNTDAEAGSNQEICINDVAQLTASGGVSFLWSTGDNTPSIFVSPTSTELFIVTVTDSNGCTDTDEVQIIVNENNSADAGTDQGVCFGGDVMLIAAGGDSYEWSTTETTASITVSPSVTSTYIVTVTDINGCTDTDEVEVKVYELPSADAGTDQALCLNESALLTASGGISYEWDSGDVTSSITVTPLITTTYIVTVTDSNGCTDIDEVEVAVYDLPTADAGADETICLGGWTDLSASGGVSYEWSTGQSTANIAVSPTVTSTYIVTVTDINGCTDTDELEVIVHPLPTADAGTDQSVCFGSDALLIAAGGDSYEWSTTETTASITVSPSVTSTYTVTVTDINGCTDTDEVEVEVYELPSADAGTDEALCLNESTTLTASGGVSYEWDSGDVTSSITVTPLITTTYIVTVTDSNGCTDIDEVEVAVYDLPTADAGADEAICLGGWTDLSASGGVSYEWSTGQSTANIAVSPTVTSTYIVTVTDINGCTDTDELEVIVHPLPTADAGTDQGVCLGGDALLIAAGGDSYEWSTTETTASITVTPSVTSTYTVTVTDINGCTDTDEVEVEVYELPTADAGPDEALCLNESTTLTASGGVSYEWDSGQETSDITVTPAVTTIYTVTVTDSNGCTDTDAAEVAVYDLPTADAGADETLCLGGWTDLSASGGVSYEWSTGQSTANVAVSPTVTSTYIVTVTDINGCTDTDELEVIVHPLPTADAGTDQGVCLGGDALLIAAGGDSYEWSTTETTASITVTPTVTSTYTVTVTDINGCTDTDEVEVEVYELPTADAGPDEALCLNESTTLTASGGVSYEWDSGQETSDITVTPAVTTIYTVSVTDSNGCTDTDAVEVAVYDLPTADAGADEAICLGGWTDLSASGGVSYEWSTGQSTANIAVSPTVTSTYTVTVTDMNGCTDTDELEVIVHPLPTADAGTDQGVCLGGDALLIAAGGDSYEWSTTETTASITVTPTVTSTYTVTVIDINGCTDTDEVEVEVYELPTADAGPDEALCLNETMTLTASGGVSYEWGSGQSTPSITVTPVVTTTYTVTVTDSNGCTDTDAVEVEVHDLPTADAGADEAICLGGWTDLSASGGVSYEWSTGQSTANIAVSPTATSTYTVTVTDVNGCTDTDELEVIVHPLPMADTGPDQDICVDDDAMLTATGGGTYEWSTGETSQTITVDPDANTFYYVTVTSDFGCIAMDTVEVRIHQYPEAVVSDFGLACGDTPAVISASGGTNYLWSTGDTTSIIEVIPPNGFAVYTVTVSNIAGCEDVASVSVFGVPAPTAYAGPDQEICPGQSAYIFASSDFGDVFEWSPDLYLDTDQGAFVISTPDSTITYTLTVSDENGCTSTDEITISVVEDTEPPVAVCQDFFVLADSEGVGVITPFLIDGESYDNCGAVTLEVDQPTVECVLMDYIITLTVTDEVGNASTCQATATLIGSDNDCDNMANGCDLCDGSDDTIDNDNDGLPDCAYPPTDIEDLEAGWYCGNPGENKVWVCHYPNQSICINYDSVFTHVSFHQNDYLGPCHWISCVFDSPVLPGTPEDHEHDHGSNLMDVHCESTITTISASSENIRSVLEASLHFHNKPCDDIFISLDKSDEEVKLKLMEMEPFVIEFTIEDECDHISRCRSQITPQIPDLEVYPNPARDNLYISGLRGEGYEIFNNKGQKILSTLTTKRLDTSEFNSGFYLIITDTGRVSKFIIIK